MDDSLRYPTDDFQLREIVAANADGIIVVDSDGRVRFLNPAAAAILGRRVDDLIGQIFGFPVLRGERAEIDLLHPDGASQVAEMRVVDTEWDGTPAQLISLRDITEHRRAQQALRDAEAFNWAILNSLTVHLAVLDANGMIIAVNESWCDFARANGDPELRYTGVGVNYFTVCQHAMGLDSEEGTITLDGMRAVLEGRLASFELEYPCHAPHEERWFVLRVVPLRGTRPGLVVSHTNVTEHRRLSEAAAEARMLRARLSEFERELRDVDVRSRERSQNKRPLAGGVLRQRLPDVFRQALVFYKQLLEESLRHRAQPDYAIEQDPRELGEYLGNHDATARDVIEVHLASVRAASANAPQVKQQAYLEEGRLLVLELMGHLASYYRARLMTLLNEPGSPVSEQR
ncbi:PAS domain S-box protein [Candidatus Chloroploca sp. Khr17]|uniref:PAS domain S-box protein n=1 Tax=Candidatus Chloroploca sp. Khr17 TaxID=2496869 RepID=UPI00101D247C|nr:PAS domain S-box protein [Candidatus Chloroploca sp. Khr17]